MNPYLVVDEPSIALIPDSSTQPLDTDRARGNVWTESLAVELRRFLKARVQCAEVAAELTQETYLRLRESLERNPAENLKALAFRIAINLSIDHLRRAAVEQRHISDLELDTIAEVIPDRSAGHPETIWVARQRLDILRAALNELPPDCRTVFILHGSEGLTYAEIARRLNISISMVNKHLARAMAHCAQRLND